MTVLRTVDSALFFRLIYQESWLQEASKGRISPIRERDAVENKTQSDPSEKQVRSGQFPVPA